MMKFRWVIMLSALGLLLWTAASGGLMVAAAGQTTAKASGAPVIVLETAQGTIEIETYPDDAPKSLAHVLALVKQGFYRGQRFHFATPGSVQFGDPLTRDMSKQEGWGNGGSPSGPVGVAETSKRKFEKGVVGLAYRTGALPRTADSQIFIIRIANPALDGKYAVLGHVVAGMPVLDKIEKGDVIKLVSIK